MKNKLLLLSILFFACLCRSSAQNPQEGWEFDPPSDNYEEGALLDLRYLNEDVAGENGFIQVDPNGDGFANGNGDPIRFWAIGGGDGTRNLSQSEIRRFGKFLAKRGVNMVRFHGHIHSVSNDINRPNMSEIDAIWKFVAAMKEEGIYATISPFWPNFIDEIPNSWNVGDYSGTSKKPWALLYFNDTFQEAFKNWLTVLYTEENPYTGIPLKDEPAVGLIQMLNEDGVFFWTIQGVEPSLLAEMESQFHDWLMDKYGSINAAYAAWDNLAALERDNPSAERMELYIIWEATQQRSGGKAKRISDQIAFYTDVQRGFYQEVYDHLRDIGCQQLINATNWKPADNARLLDAERYTYTAADVLAVNRYYDPGHVGPNTGWRVEPGDKYVGQSVLFQPHKLPVNVKQVSDKPFVMTESSWPFPHKYIAESVFLTAAYASLTGFDAYYWFSPRAEGYSDRLGTFHTYQDFAINFEPIYKFNNSTPGHLGPFPANALLYRKRYVQESELLVQEVRSLQQIYDREIPLLTENSGFDPNRDSYDNQNDPTATELPPVSYLAGKVRVEYDGDPENTTVSDELDALMDFPNKTIRSSTSELAWNYEKGQCTLDAPAAQGVTGFFSLEGETIELSDVSLHVKNDYAAISVVSIDEQPLATSEEILVQVNTIYETTNYKEKRVNFELNGQTVSGFEVEQTGQLPWKAANTEVILTLTNPNIKSAHLLDENGYEIQEVGVLAVDGTVQLELPKNTMYLVLNTEPATVSSVENIDESSWVVYPNPSQGEFVLSFDENTDAFDSIRIVDLQGREVLRIAGQQGQEIRLDTKLQTGIYLLYLQKDNRIVGRKKLLVNP